MFGLKDCASICYMVYIERIDDCCDETMAEILCLGTNY